MDGIAPTGAVRHKKKGDTNMFLTCHYFSKVLMHNTEINVVIPTPEGNEQITEAGPDRKSVV